MSYGEISIHAPARGATSSTVFLAKSTYISIHAPARGATHQNAVELAKGTISIHAPARGATELKEAFIRRL